jgi:hypothetical protein
VNIGKTAAYIYVALLGFSTPHHLSAFSPPRPEVETFSVNLESISQVARVIGFMLRQTATFDAIAK